MADGVRSLFAPWVGGAAVPAGAPATRGFRGLLGLWCGGIANNPDAPVAVAVIGSAAGRLAPSVVMRSNAQSAHRSNLQRARRR